MADIRINTTINALNEGDLADLLFTYRHREQGQTTWVESTPTTDLFYDVTGLTAGTAYEFQVFTNNSVLNKSLETSISSLTTSGGATGDITTGLVAHYTMDNISGSTLVDETGSYDGTIVGATQDTQCTSAMLNFEDNVNAYVDIPIASEITDTMTIFWNVRHNGTGVTRLISTHSSTTQNMYSGVNITSSGNINVYGDDNSGFNPSASNETVSGNCLKVVLIFNSGVIDCYVNGSQFTFNSNKDLTYNPDISEVVIGALKRKDDTLNGEGWIGETRFYNRVLAPADIALLNA